eukprot:2956469-Amphidinium_carterae.1
MFASVTFLCTFKRSPLNMRQELQTGGCVNLNWTRVPTPCKSADAVNNYAKQLPTATTTGKVA